MPPPAPKPSRLPLSLSDLLLIVILSLGSVRLIGLVLGSLQTGAADAQSGTATVVYVLVMLSVQTAVLIATVYAVAVRARGIPWRDLGFAPLPRGWTARSLLLAAVAFPMVSAINVLIYAAMGEVPPNPQLEVIAPAGFSWFGLIGMLIVAGLLAPVAEELMFRGLLYRWMRERWGVAPAMATSAVCFSLLHGVVWLIPALTALGVLLAWIYERSGSLWPAVIAHAAFNAASIALLYSALAQGYKIP